MLAIYTHKRLAALAAVIVAALAMGGCVVIKGPVQTSQQGVLGSVRTTFTICASSSNTSTHPGCDDPGNSSNAAPTSERGQVLVGFRVPDAVSGPDSFSSVSGVALTFKRSASYQQQLESNVPPPTGQHWLGYISNGYNHDEGADGTPAEQTTVSVDFALPKGANGYPYQGPFRLRPVVGARSSTDETDDARPVNCGDTTFGGGGGPFGGTTDCIDSPSESETATNISQPTRDLGIIGANAVSGGGRSVNVPFNAKYTGASNPSAGFAFSATTNLPGATLTPPAAIGPASDSSNSVPVGVRVPKKAAAGTYTVTLTARAANGETRTGTSNLVVHDKLAPTMRSLKLSPRTFVPLASPTSIAAKAKHRTRVSYRLSEAAKVKFRVQRCTKLVKGKCRRFRAAKGSFTHSGKAGANSFRFTGYVGGKRLRPGSYRLVGTPVDRSKNKGRSVRASFKIS